MELEICLVRSIISFTFHAMLIFQNICNEHKMVIVAPSKLAFQIWNDIPGAIVFICC